MANHRNDENLPPERSWPTVLRRRPELHYSDRLNLAEALLDRHVTAGAGARTAVLTRTERLSFGELQRRTNRIGHALLDLGIQPGDRVALRFFNSATFVATWLAVQKIGAIGVSTMPMLRARELAYIVNDCGATVIVCGDDLLEEVVTGRQAFDHPVVVVVARSTGAAPGPCPPGADRSLEQMTTDADERLDAVPFVSSDLALIAYTSGSTGVPKGATHTPADILSAADCYGAQVLETRPDDVFGGHPTLAFTFGLGGLLVFPFRVGASTSLIDRFTPQALLDRIAADRVSVLFCAATTYRLLLQDPDLERTHDLTSLRLCVSAGEPLPARVYEEWHRRTGVELLDGIGSTEMFHIFISSRSGQVRAGSSGTVVPGYEARVVDEQLTEVPRSTSGLLAVRGPTGCRYWRKPDRQREYVRDGWNITGDVYQQDEDGFFWFQCRNDDLIVCGGYKIVGPEVERVLIEHPAVSDAAVVATPDSLRGMVPKAFVVLKEEGAASAALAVTLQDHVKRELAPYKYPREIEFVAALPRTETGKLRRVELRQRELTRKAPRSHDAPQ